MMGKQRVNGEMNVDCKFIKGNFTEERIRG